MLVSLRKVAGTWVMAIFTFLIIISFSIFLGPGDYFRGRTSNTVATVGDAEISDVALSREFSQLQRMFGDNLNSEQARNMGLHAQALDVLVERTLYDLEADRLGLAIGDDLVREAIQANPAFHIPGGGFEKNIFESVIAGLGFSEQQYVAIRRDDLRRLQLRASVAALAAVPDALAGPLYRRRDERRVAEFFVVTNDSVGDVPEPGGAVLAAFHEKNAVRFTAPEYRRLAFIHVAPEDIVGEVAVSDEEIRAEYDDRRDEFTRPERRTVDQILTPDEATARAAHAQLMEGRDFVAVAEGVAGMSAGEVSLGTVTRNDVFGNLADTVFGLDAGEIGAPVQSPFGWHVFRVSAVEEEDVRPFAEVRAELEREIALRGAADALYRMTNALEDGLAGGATLAEAADSLRLRIDRVAAVDAGGNTPQGVPADGLPPAREFLSTAFATPEGVTSLLVESDDGGSFVVRVEEVTPPRLRPLESVRGEVLAAWREAERRKAAAERAAAAAGRINGGEEIAAVAGELAFPLATSEALRRDGDGADAAFSFEVVTALFSLDVGKAASAPARDGGGYVVARLAEIVEADGGGDGLSELRDALRVGIANDLTAQFGEMLRARYPVEVNQGAFNALF